jgi:predicted DNA-binding ribbon-helix-helix protein
MKLRRLVVHGGLVRPHVYLGRSRKKTSVSLEPVIWEALQEIAAHQGKSIHQLVTEIDLARTVTLSAAIRVYIVEFYRARTKL